MAKAKPAAARLEGDAVLVDDVGEANRIYNRGFVGEPLSGNRLRLSLAEATWLAGQGRLALDAEELLARAAVRPGGDALVLVYADLRERGLVVRHSGDALATWPRGQGPPHPPERLVHARSQDDDVAVADLRRWCHEGAAVGVVDGDGAVTYYAVRRAEPRGTNPVPAYAGVPGRGRAAHVVGRRVLVPGTADDLAGVARYGTWSPAGLLLGPAEAEALRRLAVIELPERGVPGGDPTFDVVASACQDLLERGVLPRSGFRFGTQLRGYAGDPDEDHAEWLFHCLGEDGLGAGWVDLARGVRLSHGVRKQFLIAIPGRPVEYVALDWLRL